MFTLILFPFLDTSQRGKFSVAKEKLFDDSVFVDNVVGD
jgi:hypothetical protein